MTDAAPVEPRRSRRALVVAQAAAAILGAVIVIALPLADTLAWASSPTGLGQGPFVAWLATLWLAISPALLALPVAYGWRRGERGGRLLIATWALIVLAAVVHWDAGGSWAEILARPAAFALMLWMLRPLDPPPAAVAPEQ
ncbi:hypothetical protein [Nonomuraea rhodomycinica]|uniref:Uncharacterized protein n=1 Tax=Nonomuraea rhodomycinica TaxID=1712872 RepID=A0A7Y6MHB8_9ACTN|nr:hypothetical protein [Nonomuraea rhodomycinica]NUW47000.1 hypothetical protein [Nonomuraea rhodomycinica]